MILYAKGEKNIIFGKRKIHLKVNIGSAYYAFFSKKQNSMRTIEESN